MWSAKDKCRTCNGRKVDKGKILKSEWNSSPIFLAKEILEVHIEKGMNDGEKIRFRGKADEEPGIEAGDIVIILRVADHDVFQRKGTFILSFVI